MASPSNDTQMMMAMMQAMMSMAGGNAGGGGGYGKWDPTSWAAPKAEKAPRISTMPDIVMLHIAPTSSLVQQGYPADIIAIPFEKQLTCFSDAHDILQSLLIEHDMKELVQYQHDPECTVYPEVYNAWKALGREDVMPMVAVIPALKTWAVGFGGKVNAARAAKLALSLSIAALVEPKRLEATVKFYPEFAQVVAAMTPM